MPSWVIPLIFLGFSASLSNFGGAVGLGVLPLTRRLRLEITLTFLLMEALMPVVGIILGNRLAAGIGSKGQLAAGVVLILLGGYTVIETRREARDLKIPARRRAIWLLAIALSLDNLVVGLGL